MQTQVKQEHRLDNESSDRLTHALLVNCGRALVQAVDEQQLLQSVCNILVKDSGFRMAWFGYAEPDAGKAIRLVAQAGDQDGFLKETNSENPASIAIGAGETCWIKAIGNTSSVDPVHAAALKRGYTSVLSLPLKSDGKVLGALTIYADDPGKFNERIIELLQEWSDLVALKLMTLRSREQHDGSDAGLKAGEKELQQMIDAVPQHIGMLSPDGRPLFANKIALKYHGLTLEEWSGLDHARSLVHPDDLERVLREHKQGIASEKPYEFEVRLRSKSGQYRQFLYRANPLRDDQGRIIRWYNTRTEIEDLKQTEDPLRLAIDTTPALIHSALPDGYLDYFNQRWLEYLGLSLEDVKGWKWTASIHPDDVAGIVNKWRACLASGEVFEHEARVRRADGEYRWMMHRKVPLRDERGNIVKWYGSSIDIDEIKRAEEELRRSEAYLAEAQRLSHTGTFGWIVSSGETFWSDETFRIFEYDPATKPSVELVLQRVHPEDKALLQQLIDRASQDGKDFDLEYRLLMSDGSIKHLHVVAHAIRDELCQIEFVGAVTDITATKRAEQRIRQNERELRQLIDFVPQHILVARPDGTRLYANQGMLEYHGMTLEDVQAEDVYARVFHPDDLPRVLEERRRAISGGASWEAEARLLRKDGQYRWFLIRSNPLRDEQGGIIRRYTTATDIEDRKQAEEKVQKENVALREEIDKASMFEEIVGFSPALQEVLSRVAKVAPTDSTVLVTGETGTGKELIARAIHKRSQRSSRAFVSVNCAAIPQSLIGSELFGHEKGAFTGALERRLGRFELAEGGTIFLDEIGELPLETQNALLRVLQEREFERVGGSQSIRADVRVIAATNRDLKAAIAAGTFRSDLFYRLAVFPIEIPPLRERREDIHMMVEYFIDRYAKKVGKKIRGVNKKTLELLQSYPWPGNIRELQNVIERSVIVCETENFSVDESWLTRESVSAQPVSQTLFKMPVAQEKEMIEAALAETGGRVSGPTGAAAKLGIPPSTLDSKIKSLKIDKYRFKTA